MNSRKKLIILGVIVLLGIGFAAVTATLNINGTVSINGNTSNFDVIYDTNYTQDKAISKVNGLQHTETNPSYPSNTSMTFSPANGLLAVGDYYEVSYNLLNNSTMYGALVNIECGSGTGGTGDLSPFSYSGDIENIIITAQGNKEGKIRFTYSTESSSDTNLSFTCKVVAEALSIDTTGAIVEDEEKEMDPVLLDYTGGEQTFTAPYTGTYKLETWGAQGGDATNYLNTVTYNGGYGAYSVGIINLNKGDVLYINVGGTGLSNCLKSYCTGGYNGGGIGTGSYNSSDQVYNVSVGSGGGATHIATVSGVLSDLSLYAGNNSSPILIVSGGGGGSISHRYNNADNWWSAYGGSGGGKNSVLGILPKSGRSTPATVATQTSGGCGYNDDNLLGCGTFGKGYDIYYLNQEELIGNTGGGGGGYYGGGASVYGTTTGGSGYIGNTNLTNKVMYCYNCEESTEEATKTVNTTCSSETPTENCAKIGNGYARITLVE